MVKSLIPINPTNNNAVVANARDWYGYFNFLNNYVEEGLELTSISNVDIQIGLGRSRIKGLIFSVTTAESIAVTGNDDRYLHARIIETNGNPTGIVFIFLNEISELDTDLFLGRVMLNGDNTGFDIDISMVNISSGLTPYFGLGIDGDVVISEDTVLTRRMSYRTLVVNEGVTLTSGNNLIVCQGRCLINGTISADGLGSNVGVDGIGYDKVSAPINANSGRGGDGGSFSSIASNPYIPATDGVDAGVTNGASISRRYSNVYEIVEYGIDYRGAGGVNGVVGGNGGGWDNISATRGLAGVAGVGSVGGGVVGIVANILEMGVNGRIVARGLDGGDASDSGNGGTWFGAANLQIGSGGGGASLGGTAGDGGCIWLLYKTLRNVSNDKLDVSGGIRGNDGNAGNGGVGNNGNEGHNGDDVTGTALDGQDGQVILQRL